MSSSTTPGSSGRSPRGFPIAAAVCLVWLLVWIWISWPYSLDDALIHLRYADHLLHEGAMTYDGVHHSFGTSSLLYVALLAGLRSFSASPLLPRAVTSVVHVAFFLGLGVGLYGSFRRRAQLPHALWLSAVGLLVVIVTPSAVRWLDDGMETGLVLGAVTVGVFLLRHLLAERSKVSVSLTAGLLLYGFLCVLLRVELLLLLGCITAMALLSLARRAPAAAASRWRADSLFSACAPLAGGLLAAALILLTMHALLPDTAVAKAYGIAIWRGTLSMTLTTMASSFSFGLGLVFFWLVSLLALAVFARVQLADLPANLLFPTVLLLAALRGQQIQGIRYFGWTLLFPLLWNLLRTAEEGNRRAPATDRRLSWVVVLFFVVLVPLVAWESRTFSRIFADRGVTLATFRAQHLEGLRGQPGIAEDVGFIGYFTQGDICDVFGLVNGRAAAGLRYPQRFAHCLSLHPTFAFGSAGFLQRVAAVQDLSGWSLCPEYRFDNVRTLDLRYLVVSPGELPVSCPNTRRPITALLRAAGPVQ